METAAMTEMLELAVGRWAHCSGAVWLAPSRTVLIADTHLGYGWAQRRRGELGPVEDVHSGARLMALIEQLQPRRVVVLGDLVHVPKPGAAEREAIEGAIALLRGAADLVLVRGNHDRAFARDFGHLDLPLVEEWTGDGVVARHGDRLQEAVPADLHLVLGHLHPVWMFRDSAGAKQRVRLFLTNRKVTVLPAFSAFSSGYDVTDGLPSELRKLFGEEDVEGLAVTRTKVFRLDRRAFACAGPDNRR